MNLDQTAKEYEDYKDGLYHTAHLLDSFYSQICDHFLYLMSIHNNVDTLASTIKDVLNLSVPISESETNNYYENIQGIVFMVSVLWPLQLSLTYIESQGKNTIESILMDNSNVNTNVSSARSLYDLIIRMPESIVLPLLQEICEKNDSFSLIDAYQSNNAKDFIDAFEKQKDKKFIIDAFVSKARKTELINNLIESLDPDTNWTVWDYFRLSQKSIFQICQESGLGLSYRIAQDPQRFLFADPKILEKEAKQAYKSALMKYLSKKGIFDEYEKSIIEEIIQDQNFIALTNELLAECEQTIKNESMGEESTASTKNDKLKPLPFPYENIKIKKDKKRAFLDELYELLLNHENPDKPYIQHNQKNTFIYLFGGSEEKPSPCIPILWLRQKNELQAFLLAFFGENAGKDPGWSKLNNYFWLNIENTNPQLANSIGNLSKQAAYTLDKLVKPLIEKYTSSQF